MENDDLGLEQPLRLGRVSRTAALTDDLLFEADRGLPQIRNNYPKLVRAMRRNDRKCAERSGAGGGSARQARVACEVQNLEKVLSFYQLWCHGLFPRATFRDCLKMLRSHKSLALKEYRRGLIANELRRLKIEKGIIVDDGDEDAAENADHDPAPADDFHVPAAARGNENDSASDDDWGFLSGPSNGLFVGADAPHDDADEFPENDAQLALEDDQYEQELEVMREMGL